MGRHEEGWRDEPAFQLFGNLKNKLFLVFDCLADDRALRVEHVKIEAGLLLFGS